MVIVSQHANVRNAQKADTAQHRDTRSGCPYQARMSGVPVIIGPATDSGRLFPNYKNSIGILALESALPKTCPHGVSIDGKVILDFDDSRTLVGLELIAPMSAWKGKQAVTQPLGRPGDICLGNGLNGSVEYNWPVVVSKDVQRDMARISFGDTDFDRAVALSDSVCALLKNDYLTGFWFSFAR